MYKIEYCGVKELWKMKALFTSYKKMAIGSLVEIGGAGIHVIP